MEKEIMFEFKDLFEGIKSNLFLDNNDQTPWSLLSSEKSGDEIDVVNEERDRILEFRLHGRKKVFLKKVDAALDRIDKGIFGQCLDCGDEIDLGRLKARPTATLCIHCKEEQEHQEHQTIHARKDLAKGPIVNNKVLAMKSRNDGPIRKTFEELVDSVAN